MTGAVEDVNHPWLRPCDDLRIQSRHLFLYLRFLALLRVSVPSAVNPFVFLRALCGLELVHLDRMHLEILLPQDRHVVRHMPGYNVRARPNSERIAAGDAFSRPGFFRQISEERNGREPHLTELLHMS